MVSQGDIIGTVKETVIVEHKIMIPKGIEGKIVSISEGDFTITEKIAQVETKDGIKEIIMMQKWPVRKGRPYFKSLIPNSLW